MKQHGCNPDLPSTWKKFEPRLCEKCRATCCCLPLEVKLDDLVRLELVNENEKAFPEKKIAKILKAKKWIKSYRTSTQLFLMETTSEGACIFLDSFRFCKVYEKRPEVCRSFPTSMGPRVGYCPYLPKK